MKGDVSDIHRHPPSGLPDDHSTGGEWASQVRFVGLRGSNAYLLPGIYANGYLRA